MDLIYTVARKFGGASNAGSPWDSNPEQLKVNLEQVSSDTFIAFIKKDHCPRMAAQVVALAHMAVGAKLCDELRNRAIQACEQENVSGWSNPATRKTHLTEFAAMVRAYDDKTPQRPPEKDLWEALGDHLTSGASGMLNDNV